MVMVRAEKRVHLAHRIAWRLAYGEIPTGMCVCHHCDTPACCEPTHLFLGTAADNAADRDRKGRHNVAFGEAHGRAKLTAAHVTYIRASTVPPRVLAAHFGVCYETINRVRRREYWRD